MHRGQASSRLRLNWNWEGSSHAQHWEKKNCSTKKECDHVIISALPVCAFLMLPAAETFSVLDGPLCTRIVPPITKRITDLNFYTPFHWCLDLVRKPTAVPFESEKYHRINLPNPFSKWNETALRKAKRVTHSFIVVQNANVGKMKWNSMKNPSTNTMKVLTLQL